MKNLSTVVVEALGKENADLKSIKNNVLGLVFAGQVKTVSDKSDIDLIMTEILNEISLQAEKKSLLLEGDKLTTAITKALKSISDIQYSTKDDILKICQAVSRFSKADVIELETKNVLKTLGLTLPRKVEGKEKAVPVMAFMYFVNNMEKSVSEVKALMNDKDLEKGLIKYDGTGDNERKIKISENQVNNYFRENLKYFRIMQKLVSTDENVALIRKAFK